MYFDTHIHFDGLSDDLDAIIQRAVDNGVSRMAAIGGSNVANNFAVDLANKLPENIIAVVGYDRDCAGNDCPQRDLDQLLQEDVVRAVGEIGLDFHYHPETKIAQQELLERMLNTARMKSLPVVVHSREADSETLDALSSHSKAWGGDADSLGVLHCYTGGLDQAKKILDLGYYISFSGIATFKNADEIREVAKFVPEDRMLIETDAPYLAPVPHRGKRNEPAFVKHVAEVLAEVRSVTVSEIAEVTFANARCLFGC